MDLQFSACMMCFLLPAVAEPASRGLGGQEMVTFGSAESRGSPAFSGVSSSGSHLAVCNSSQPSVDAPLLHEGLSRTLSRESSQSGSATRNSEDLSDSSCAQVQSTQASPNGISIFQGYDYLNGYKFGMLNARSYAC